MGTLRQEVKRLSKHNQHLRKCINAATDPANIEAALLDAHDMDMTIPDYAQAVSRYIMGLVDREDR